MWITYTLLGLLFLGMGDFIKKMMLKNGGDKEVFLFICFIIYVIVFGINYLLFSDFVIDYTLISGAFIVGAFDFLAPIGMLTALKYLDTSFAFISIRVLASFIILYIGTSFLGDSLSIYNIIGFLIGIFAIFLLSGFSFKEKHKIHKKGIIAVILAIIGVVGGHSYFKYIVADVDIASYMFFKFLVSFLFIILYMTIRRKFVNFNYTEVKKVINFSLITGIVFIIYFLYLIPNIYLLGTLSLSYKILSYSLIVPIILSAIIYKEKITKMRLVAFILTIVSITLFII